MSTHRVVFDRPRPGELAGLVDLADAAGSAASLAYALRMAALNVSNPLERDGMICLSNLLHSGLEDLTERLAELAHPDGSGQ